jgi:hypothetical protein
MIVRHVHTIGVETVKAPFTHRAARRRDIMGTTGTKGFDRER